MAMMPGLQLNVGQQLKLTPQLQQSIKILQYSALEVQQTIETTLQNNFMLEVADSLDEELEEEIDLSLEEESEGGEKKSEEAPTKEELNLEASDQIDPDLEIDCDWEEVYTDYETPSSSATVSNEDYTAAENYTAAHETLHDKLYWQSDIYPWEPPQDVLADFIIDRIDEDGFLSVELESLLDEIHSQQPELSDVGTQQLEEVLKVVQQFEPSGVGARSIQETLSLQLQAKAPTPHVVTARQLVENHFDWLTDHDYKRIKKYYALSEEDLTEVLRTIQSLNPRPGGEFSDVEHSVVVPDLLLSRAENGWKVELNPSVFPRLKINTAYIDLCKNLTDDAQCAQVKEHLIEAKGLIKSIHSRGETLLRVGQYIVSTQSRFFEEGEQAMQPLVLRDVAEALDLHESTISRATNQKYIQTPRGTYELKYFFSTGVSQYGAEDQSSVAIKSHIKELLENENSAKPLSDNKITALLEERGITVARRTVAKYRESLGIPSSSERKKMNSIKR
jgi:RNA polymerase sigma-54 factor